MSDPFINMRNVPDHSLVSRQGLTQSDGRTKVSDALPDSWANVLILRAVTSDCSQLDSCCYLSGLHGTPRTRFMQSELTTLSHKLAKYKIQYL